MKKLIKYSIIGLASAYILYKHFTPKYDFNLDLTEMDLQKDLKWFDRKSSKPIQISPELLKGLEKDILWDALIN